MFFLLLCYLIFSGKPRLELYLHHSLSQWHTVCEAFETVSLSRRDWLLKSPIYRDTAPFFWILSSCIVSPNVQVWFFCQECKWQLWRCEQELNVGTGWSDRSFVKSPVSEVAFLEHLTSSTFTYFHGQPCYPVEVGRRFKVKLYDERDRGVKMNCMVDGSGDRQARKW